MQYICSMFEFTYEITEDQTESAYRHLHHADALRLMERGRLDLLIQMGFPNDALFARDLYLVITSISVSYLRELIPGTVFVRCHSLRIEGRDLVIEQEILNARRKRCVEATVISCFISGTTRRGILPPADFAAAFIAATGSV